MMRQNAASVFVSSTSGSAVKIAQHFGQAAWQYDNHAQVQQQLAKRILTKVAQIEAQEQQIWLDLGTGTGALARQLPVGQVIALDLALPMLQQAKQLKTANLLCADIMQLPFAPQTVAGITANLSLQWCQPFEQCLTQLQQVLKPNGRLLATVPLDDCFTELQPLIEQGQLSINRFASMTALQALFASGNWSSFSLTPIEIQINFASVKALLTHFKQTGAHFCTDRAPGLRGRLWWQQINQQLGVYQTEQGFPLTWKIALIEATR